MFLLVCNLSAFLVSNFSSNEDDALQASEPGTQVCSYLLLFCFLESFLQAAMELRPVIFITARVHPVLVIVNVYLPF